MLPETCIRNSPLGYPAGIYGIQGICLFFPFGIWTAQKGQEAQCRVIEESQEICANRSWISEAIRESLSVRIRGIFSSDLSHTASWFRRKMMRPRETVDDTPLIYLYIVYLQDLSGEIKSSCLMWSQGVWLLIVSMIRWSIWLFVIEIPHFTPIWMVMSRGSTCRVIS